nr:MAG TPA: hypothetical protein [Caudoviricetes sp.]DAV64777.1 MAG TPA: hypothetical protein [Caudoviricetes sp.]
MINYYLYSVGNVHYDDAILVHILKTTKCFQLKYFQNENFLF